MLTVRMKPFVDSFAELINGYDNFYTTIVLSSVMFYCAYFYLKIRKLPPGPYGLPLFGYLPMFTAKKRFELVRQIGLNYKSDVVSVRVYGRIIVFINSYQLVKECFVKRTDLADRIDVAFFNMIDSNYVGIISNSGNSWKEHRRFSLYVMRDFGMGKLRAEDIIQRETEMVMNEFRTTQGRAFNPQTLVNLAVSNIICSVVFGQRYEYNDEEFITSLRSMNELIMRFGNTKLWFLLRFKLGKILLFRMLAQITHYFDGFANFARKSVKEHINRYDGSVNDLIDAYLKECYDDNKVQSSSFTEKNLPYLIIDMFLAGSETTFTTLRWALLYMASYPKVQDRIYKELKEAIGDRVPSMSDKKFTPYTEATLNEIQRLNTLLPFGLFHTNSSTDFEINGYRIPKGTPVAANLHAIHRDPKIWAKPDEFDPNNFLHDGKVVNLEYLVPFSIGRRSCAGEALAKMELYIFFSSWLLNFEVKFPDDHEEKSLEGSHRAVWIPDQFDIRLLPREAHDAD